MDKHTPGPWKVFNTTDVFSDGDAPFVQVADCVVHKSVLHDNRELPANETAANARLIAAAPDLITASEAAKDFIAEICWLTEEYEACDLVDQLRAAIDKAKKFD